MIAWMLAALLAATPLVEAVRQQDVAAVKALLKSGADVNRQEGDGATALHWAANADSTELVRLLLDAGASPAAANDLGVTPLHLAAANGNVAVLTLLLGKRANPNAVTAAGVTPLMDAARSGRVEAVRLLLAHGADVNARESSRRQTALMWAVSRQYPEIVKALLENGADVRARTEARPITVMLDRGPRRAVKTSMADAHQIQAGGSTPLLLAAQVGCVECTRLLLARGADVNDAAADGKSALVMAAFSGHTDVARHLVSAGADPNAAGAGYTALHAAALRGDLPLVQALLAAGANPNATITKGSPVRRFGSQWALPTPFVGATPLVVAAAYLETGIIKALLAAGASAEARLPDGTSALQIATGDVIEKEARPSDLAKWSIVDSDSPEVPRPEADVIDAVRTLIDGGADAAHAADSGDTALHAAAMSNLPAVIQLLVERGAPVNTQNKGGQTPLALTLPRAPQGRGNGFPGYPEAEAMLRKLGAR
ncbi:MAG TPA: ankyrin repeat domain-containing protein [Vicinamibacterales bacterium]|nr:ankyrin repeat domain-containing protein [Vicinamibacterales bacterium]